MLKKVFFPRFTVIAIVGILTAWGMFLRYERLDKRDLWGDEIFQLAHSKGKFKPVWGRISYGDNSSFPGDYLLTYPFVQNFGENKWGLAIPHVITTLLGFYFLYKVSEQYFQTPVGYLVAFSVIAFHRELIFHAFELRPYAVLPTLALAVFYLTQQLRENLSRFSVRGRFLSRLFLVFVILFHAYGLLMAGIAAFYHFLWLKGAHFKKEVLWSYAKFFIITFVVALPMWLWYASGNPFQIKEWHSNIFYYAPHPFVEPWGFMRFIVGNLLGCKASYISLMGAVAAFVVLSRKRFQLLGFLLVMVVLPLQCILQADILKNYIFVQRQFVWVVPFFAIWLGWCWDLVIVSFLPNIAVRQCTQCR